MLPKRPKKRINGGKMMFANPIMLPKRPKKRINGGKMMLMKNSNPAFIFLKSISHKNYFLKKK